MERTIYYYFDPKNSQYRRVEDRLGTRLLRVSRIAFLATGMAMLALIGYSAYFELPGELILKRQIAGMETNYRKMEIELAALHQVIATIENRDDNVYRVVLGAEPVDKSLREGGIGGVERYPELQDHRVKGGELAASLFEKINKLKRKLYIESISQDQLMQLSEEKQRRLAAIPAIQPLANLPLASLASGFGLRMHPVYKVIKMHTGIDFSCEVGTPVFATADGEVIATDTAVTGYGKLVIIDHGYGYQTRYGHLRNFKVKLGDRVKRGVLIANTGNTGVSTAPHLHYEVLLNGFQINPIQYFFKDISPVEYEQISQLASIQNQSLGN